MEMTGGDALMKRLKAIDDPHALLRKLQLDTVAEAKRLVPRKTGNLGRSIAPGAFSGRSALVVAAMPYAAFVELGTRPHEIRPRNGRVLAWPASGAGRKLTGSPRKAMYSKAGAARLGGWAFAAVVHHPGTKPKPFLLPGAREALRRNGLRDTTVSLWNGAA